MANGSMPNPTPLGRPFFILGSGRSGTSLLSRMLNQHPNLAVPPESHLYNSFHRWLTYYGDLAAPRNRAALVTDILAISPMQNWSPRLRVDEVLAHVDGEGFGAVVDAVMRTWAAKHGKTRWGEKTPGHIGYWRQISADFERSPVIHVVRDGRDVAISMIKARFGPKSIYSCAKAWKAVIERMTVIRNSLPPELFLEIRYEDLLEDAERVLRRVCDFLGEPYADEMLSYYHDNTPYLTDRRNQQNLAKPLLVDNARKWRTGMTEDELRIFEAVAGGTLTAYGYPRAIADAAISAGEERWRRYVEGPYRRCIGRLRDRQGQKERLIFFGVISRRLGSAAATRLASRARALSGSRLRTKISAN